MGAMKLLHEFTYFLRYEKRWWLLPLVVIALVSVVVLLVTAGMGGESYRYDIF